MGESPPAKAMRTDPGPVDDPRIPRGNRRCPACSSAGPRSPIANCPLEVQSTISLDVTETTFVDWSKFFVLRNFFGSYLVHDERRQCFKVKFQKRPEMKSFS